MSSFNSFYSRRLACSPEIFRYFSWCTLKRSFTELMWGQRIFPGHCEAFWFPVQNQWLPAVASLVAAVTVPGCAFPALPALLFSESPLRLGKGQCRADFEVSSSCRLLQGRHFRHPSVRLALSSCVSAFLVRRRLPLQLPRLILIRAFRHCSGENTSCRCHILNACIGTQKFSRVVMASVDF